MAYYRWGEHCSVYVYASSMGGIRCEACLLLSEQDRVSFVADTAEQMIEHLRSHLATGDKVPNLDEVAERLRTDQARDFFTDRGEVLEKFRREMAEIEAARAAAVDELVAEQEYDALDDAAVPDTCTASPNEQHAFSEERFPASWCAFCGVMRPPRLRKGY